MNTNEKIAELVKLADNMVAEYWVRSGFTFGPPPIHRADYLSDKWCRITTVEGSRESVYAFVALQDFATKALGTIKTGDIHKAATWKAPAKHARGNVFAADYYKCMTPNGIVYLR